MDERYYLVTILTNDKGQDASKIEFYSSYESAEIAFCNKLPAYINAPDVYRCYLAILNPFGVADTKFSKLVEHIPAEE